MDKKTVYIHIGSDKTGSTAIQRFSFQNRGLLKTYGLHFVSTKYDHHGPLLDALRNKNFEYIEALLNDIRIQNSPKYLITFEGLYHLKDDELTAFIEIFKEFNLQIIFYIRRRSDLLRSGIAQTLKFNKLDSSERARKIFFDKKFTIPASSQNFNYLAIIRRWQNELVAHGHSEESFNLRVYEKSAFFLGDLILDFYSILNICEPEKLIEGIEFLRSLGVTNSSISPSAQYLMTLINALDVDDIKRDAIKNLIMRHDDLNEKSHSIIPDELARQLDEHYKNQDSLIAKEFFNREMLFSEPPKFSYQEPSGKSFMKLIEGIFREKTSGEVSF